MNVHIIHFSVILKSLLINNIPLLQYFSNENFKVLVTCNKGYKKLHQRKITFQV